MSKSEKRRKEQSAEGEDLRYIEDLSHRANLGRVKKRKKRVGKRILKGFCRLLVLGVVCYLICVYSNFPFIAKWRNIYIETAMSTMTHQWLATYFIPSDVVNEVVERANADQKAQEELESSWELSWENQTVPEADSTEEVISAVEERVVKSEEELFYEKFSEVDTAEFREFLKANPEFLADGYAKIDFEDLDGMYGLMTVQGDQLLAVDAVNNLILIGISGPDYVGKLAIVKDAAQVDLAKAENLGDIGDPIYKFGEDNDCLVAVNASRFQDAGGVSYGGVVAGSLVIDGVDYGVPHKGSWKYFGMKYDNLFYITKYKSANIEEYRWAVECYPALVVNGENVAEGSFGMGVQPRTTVGQTRTGDFMLLVVDGRQFGYSIGCEIGECSEIMIRYGCFQGADLDGGSSSVMWYKGQLITRSCSATGMGRYTPDAVIIRRADDPDVIAQKK